MKKPLKNSCTGGFITAFAECHFAYKNEKLFAFMDTNRQTDGHMCNVLFTKHSGLTD